MNAAQLWKEFKGFALKGSLIDLAVAVIIGGAFAKVVDSLAKNVLMPLLSYVTPAQGYRTWRLGRVEIGVFLGELLNFLVIALVLYAVLIKLLGALKSYSPLATDADPATKECPLCLSTVPYRARKCAHCTADLPGLDG